MDRPRTRGVTIRIYLVDGSPQGLRLVSRSGWTGSCLAFARADYANARIRSELIGSGVYILTGPDPEGKRSERVYIGEGDDVRIRLDTHQRDRDFWTSGFVLSTTDASLNKAHVRYLESRLIGLAREIDNAAVDNLTAPLVTYLSEHEVADMESYLENALILLPLVGVTLFDAPLQREILSKPNETSVTGWRPTGEIKYFLKSHDVYAEAVDDSRGFTVFEGAQARKEPMVMIESYRRLREQLIEEGILLDDHGKHLRLTKTYVFDSPSAAASVIIGGSRNGRTEWKDASGNTLRQNQERSTPSQVDSAHSRAGLPEDHPASPANTAE